ncbi:MAG: hypothetical protein AB8G99_03780, partial [Planctomycetaceae bacterium]
FIGVVGLPLCVLGIVMAWHAVRAIRSLYRLRNARLQLDYPTGVRGIGISGQIFLPLEIQPDSGFLVSLTVVHRIKRKDNDGDDVHTEAARGQWQQRVLATKCEGGMEVVFRFPISKRYRDLNDNRPIIWTVELLTSPPHVGCDLHFEVPVFSVPSSNWQLPEKLPSEQTQLVTLGECLERNRGTVLQQGPDKHIVELGSPKKWYGGEEPAYRLEYDRERIEVSGGGNPRVQIATCDVEKIGRRLSGYAKSISDLPFGFPRERYEVEVLMSDQTRHTHASFERLADAKELIRSMRRVTAIRTKTLPDNP